MLYVIIAVLGLAAAGWLIIKRVHAATSLLLVGFVLLMLAAALGRSGATTQEIESSGNAFYDELLVIQALFQDRFSGTGMAIMVLFGFVAYMRSIGADAKTVVVLSRPLSRFHGSYWMVPIGFVLGTLLSLVVPSAAALSLLLIATLLPALIAAGLTPLTVGAVIVTSSTIVPTPLEAGLIQGADLTGMSVSEFVFGHVALATVPALVVMALTHMWWQWRCDRIDARKGEAAAGADAPQGPAAGSASSIEDALERAKDLPALYALLPLLPLLLIIVCALLNRFGVVGFEAEILPVTLVSLVISVLIEAVRHRDVRGSVEAGKAFFTGMGEGAAGVVALIVAAAVVVEAVNQLGIITMLTDATEGLHSGALILVLVFVLSTTVLAVLTGSGVAPYFAFSEAVPALAAGSGILPARMLTAIWGASNTMRQVSPVSAAVLIVAGAIKATPLQLVRRTSIPMVAGMVSNVLFAYLFIHA